ncbi:MAG: D-alanyl-D-alanine carboxypeptidase/D-alanyl-D-alanine-endopeptidase [bacterium]|nr:D-alanyl-D-alanine carboxypeptidase/D-alanyl-D-alanine-endopeptidase [bacterium]
MKKLIILFLLLVISVINVQAKGADKDFSKIINDFGINADSITISLRNAQNGREIYSLNSKILMPPASVQKILTAPAIYETLGSDYKFTTKLYTDGENSYLIELGADPYLKTSDLKALVEKMDAKTKKVSIDDSILDSITWGEGWQWDDNLNTLMPKFGSYNLNRNTVKLTVIPQTNGKSPLIINNSKYPLVVFNNLQPDNKNMIIVQNGDFSNDNVIKLTGNLARQATVQIPVLNIKTLFERELSGVLEDNKLYLTTGFENKKTGKSNTLITAIEHDMSNVLNDILKNSDNFVTETTFKLAGKKYNGAGSAKSGVEMFNNYCKKHKIDSSEINLTDGSGVSKNNLVSSEFVTEFLYKIKKEKIVDYMAKPGEGTLAQRLLPLNSDLKAKTGTLAGISSIAGYITTKNGNEYTFCIIQNDVKFLPSDKKALEDYILREVYLNF